MNGSTKRREFSRRWPNTRSWSDLQRCPDCNEMTLRVFWFEREGEPPKAVSEFCDFVRCTRGDQ